MAYVPSIGSISTGTLRTEDLMISFADELAMIAPDHDLVKEAAAVQTLWAAGWNDIYDHDLALDLVNELQDELSTNAPPYCYFGTLEGDGADFGFWPCVEEIEELPRVSDPSEVEDHLGEECAFVNDHGNVTIYSAAGKVILELV